MSRTVRVSAARRNWGEDDSGCDFMHVDMDSFFAAVELLEHPELVGKPVIVGGSSARGVVTTATYEAREYGVHAGMPMSAALRLCPHATVLPTRHYIYRAASAAVMEILREITPEVEQVSIDEAFLGIGGARRRLGSAVEIGNLVRERVSNELGLTATVGIASVKFVAKIASTQAKPDGLLLIPQPQTVPFLHELPVGALWGVGSRTQEVLHRIGIDWVKELAEADRSRLVRALGIASAHKLQELAQGIDRRQIETKQVDKSISHEETFETDLRSAGQIEAVMLRQSHQVAGSLRRKGLLARGVSIKVRSGSFKTLTRSTSLPTGTDTGKTIYEAACRLFRQLPLPPDGIRLVGVKAERLLSAALGVQALIDEDPKQRRVETAADQLRERFGSDVVSAATLLSERGKREERHLPKDDLFPQE
ncbi:DNA polymerase IV [Boudabousia marimammalium]|uniref:DNA polymerase IV n=1 Tax=Boudabousia marimammalium TaxID=156892 RepID=A0A1Q5PP84_9ACTO|nr:DNA polymerase IV [Boudabousia marimammalium]OKL49250.1 DNA polymerase IV [Boudabousia marimammalium]